MSSANEIPWEGDEPFTGRLVDHVPLYSDAHFKVADRTLGNIGPDYAYIIIGTNVVVFKSQRFVALIHDRTHDQYLVLRTYRSGVDEICVSLPMGNLPNSNQFLKDVGVVLESVEHETGYLVDFDNCNQNSIDASRIACNHIDVQYVDRSVSLITVDADRFIKDGWGSHLIQHAWVSFDQLREWVEDGTITDMASCSLINAVALRQLTEKLRRYE